VVGWAVVPFEIKMGPPGVNNQVSLTGADVMIGQAKSILAVMKIMLPSLLGCQVDFMLYLESALLAKYQFMK